MKSNLTRGFTILELLAVVAIVGVLAAIIVVNADPFRDKATGIEAAAWVQTAELVLEQYRVACGQYPPRVGDNAALPYVASQGCATGTSLGSFVIEAERARLVDVQYVPLARDVDSSDCIGYHLGIELEDPADNRLTDDADVSSLSLPEGFAVCAVPGASYMLGVDGADPIYDVVRPSALAGTL